MGGGGRGRGREAERRRGQAGRRGGRRGGQAEERRWQVLRWQRRAVGPGEMNSSTAKPGQAQTLDMCSYQSIRLCVYVYKGWVGTLYTCRTYIYIYIYIYIEAKGLWGIDRLACRPLLTINYSTALSGLFCLALIPVYNNRMVSLEWAITYIAMWLQGAS